MDWQGWFTIALTVSVLLTLVAVPRLSTDVVLMGGLLLMSNVVLPLFGITDADAGDPRGIARPCSA